MTVIEIDDDLAAALKAKAASQQLKLEDWFRVLAGTPASNGNAAAADNPCNSLKLPALPLGNIGSLHRRDIYKDAS